MSPLTFADEVAEDLEARGMADGLKRIDTANILGSLRTVGQEVRFVTYEMAATADDVEVWLTGDWLTPSNISPYHQAMLRRYGEELAGKVAEINTMLAALTAREMESSCAGI